MFSWEMGETYTENVISTNIIGMIYGSQIAAAGMLKQGHGAIYSMEGLGTNNMIQPKTILYGTTKYALTYFMKGLAKNSDAVSLFEQWINSIIKLFIYKEFRRIIWNLNQERQG